MLVKAGYRHHGVFGKWHLGHSDIKYYPLRRGITEFVGHFNGTIDCFTHEREGQLAWHCGFNPNHDLGYSTDLIADAAVQFIDHHAAEEAPFFCYAPFNAPHSPLQAKNADLDRYRHLADEESRLPPSTKKRTEGGRPNGGHGGGKSQRQTLVAMISYLDRGIGRILCAFEQKVLSRELYSCIGQNGEADEQLALMSPSWKLIVIGPRIADDSIPRSERESLLSRIGPDLLETTNLAAKHNDVVDRMSDSLRAFRALQPADAVAPYRSREDPFVPLPNWRMPDPQVNSGER